ncbi:pilin [Candidatus Parcubacteria bacterium]|nr:pilin [Candidatus Parcubacteria bacterium]
MYRLTSALLAGLGGPTALDLPDVSLDTGLSSLIGMVFTAAGSLAVVFLLIGAVKYTLSGGDPSGLRSAKDTILYAIIGLIVTLLAFGIVTFVSTRIS